jgi:hypothetical protein
MSKPLVTFPDPEAAVINALKAAFLPRVEAYKPATITTAFPASALTNATHVQVELEVGNADDYPIAERAQVRVTCYAAPGKRSNVKDLASLAQGLLYTHAGGDVAGVDILVGRSDVITDPDTKNLMVWFLARVNLKATLLAS